MLYMAGMLEDTGFHAVREEKRWKVTVWDAIYGETIVYSLTDEQFGACLALASAGDFQDEKLNNLLWNIAEQSMPGNLSIIP